MTALQRIKNIITALCMIACSSILLFFPENGYYFVLLLLSLSLTIYGLKTLFYYFTMARKMVGGQSILYRGVVILDLGIFSLTVADNPTVFAIVYLLLIHLFTGVVDILRALEAKSIAAPSWRFKFISGVVNIILALIAFIAGAVMKSMETLVYLYCLGLLSSAGAKLISAFRRTAIVYIQ